MPLENITPQPLAFNSVRPTDCFAMCDEREYCMPAIDGDPIYGQFQQTPCGPSITCDGDFSAIDEGSDALPDGDFDAVEAELIVNGNFTGNATGWTLGTDWAYNSNDIRKTAGNTNTAYQTIGSTLVSYAIYKVSYSIANYGGSGTLTPQLSNNGTSVLCLGAAGGNANTTFTTYIKVGIGCNRLSMIPTSGWGGDLDAVSVKRIAASWDFGGDEQEGWSIDSNGFAQTITGGAYGYTDLSLQCLNVINPNTDYEVTVDVEDGEGAVCFVVGGFPIGQSIFYTLTGGAQTITFNITSGLGTFFYVVPNININTKIKISNIAVVELSGDCWDFDTDQWTVTTAALCKTPGSSDIVTNSAILTGGKKYQIKITINGRNNGYINLTNDGATSANFDTNKTHTWYFNPANDSTLSIFANNTFDGCISNLLIYELRNDFLFELRDGNGDTVANLTDNPFGQQNVFYHDDYVTLKFFFNKILDINDRVISPGCYKVWCFDLCELQYEEIVTDKEFANPFNTYWFDSGGSPEVTNTITAGVLVFECPSNPGAATFAGSVGNKWDGTLWPSNPGIPLGSHNYHIEFDITENSDPANITVAVQLGLGIGQGSLGGAAVGHYSADVFNVNPSNSSQQVVNIAGVFAGVTGTVKIDNVSVHRIEPFDVTYVSKCIKYASNFPCTKVIKSFCRADTFGFKFLEDSSVPEAVQNVIFELSHRVEIEAGNDAFPESTDDYLFSTGTKQRNYGQSETVYTVVTGHISRDAHACIRLQRICQFFYIGEPLDEFIEWFPLPSDYNPEWNKNLLFILAKARFEVQRKDRDVKFFRRS